MDESILRRKNYLDSDDAKQIEIMSILRRCKKLTSCQNHSVNSAIKYLIVGTDIII